MDNIFERATRTKAKFASVKGLLSVEDLWDLPLSSKTGADLDTLAINAHRQLKAMAEESFVAATNNAHKAPLELQLDVLKHIINVKLMENQAKTDAQFRKVERDRLMAALERKDEQAIDALTPEELRARLAALKP